jgi:hypothetical protein
MKRINVISSNLKSVGYDAEKSILEIEFNSGSIYQYFGVPRNVFDLLMNASSKGGFHSDFIKDKFQYQRVK